MAWLLSSAPALSRSLDRRQGTRVLHVGDSFVSSGLSQALDSHFRSVGANYSVHSRASSTTNMWAYDKALSRLFAKRADLVLVTLGANEVFIPRPETRASAVRAIVKKIGPRPCVWIAPPPWKGQSGILDVIRDNVAPCLYFDSEAEVGSTIERRKDGIHPSTEGGRIWAEALWLWLEARRDPMQGPWALKAEAE